MAKVAQQGFDIAKLDNFISAPTVDYNQLDCFNAGGGSTTPVANQNITQTT